MKTIILILMLSNLAFANDIEILSESIAEFCEFNSTKSDEEKLTCGEKLTNCIISVDGKWNDELLFRCLKAYIKGEVGAPIIRSVSEQKELQRQF